jgi:exonuclease VII large subunit
MKAVLFASLLALAALPTCKPDTAKTATDAAAAVNPASPAEVRAQFNILRDSADANWQRMMTSDDQKLTEVRGLLQDLKKQPRLNAAQVRALAEQAGRIKPQRYDRQSMASSAVIDQYDAVQDSVLKPLVLLAAPEGNAPTARIRDYVEHIMLADANVVSYRAHYDAAAKAYNNYLRLHQAELAQMGDQYARLRPLPLFELSK